MTAGEPSAVRMKIPAEGSCDFHDGVYGDVSILDSKQTDPVWREPSVILAERTLLDRLDLKVGSTLSIGEANVTIGGILGEQPDRLADRLAYGPKLLMSRETLAKTGLVQPGSLIRWTYRVKLPNAAASAKNALLRRVAEDHDRASIFRRCTGANQKAPAQERGPCRQLRK